MEEHLISYEVAKLAKKKGFDIKTKYHYGRVFPQSGFNNLHDESYLGITDFSSYAPTQSLLQKWLRDTHQMHIEIQWYDDNSYAGYLVSDVFTETETEYDYDSADATGMVYEEVLEVCLFKALQHI
jgi:hypothetical protein